MKELTYIIDRNVVHAIFKMLFQCDTCRIDDADIDDINILMI